MQWYTDKKSDRATEAAHGFLPACVPKVYEKLRAPPSLIRRTIFRHLFALWILGSAVVWSAVTGLVWLYYA
jgi:hypothetical protein